MTHGTIAPDTVGEGEGRRPDRPHIATPSAADLTKREWFAGHAMAGFIGDLSQASDESVGRLVSQLQMPKGTTFAELVAAMAYRYADAMIAAAATQPRAEAAMAERERIVKALRERGEYWRSIDGRGEAFGCEQAADEIERGEL